MTVKVYTIPTCPWCEQAKAFLKAQRVPFEEVGVPRDRALAEEPKAISGHALPQP